MRPLWLLALIFFAGCSVMLDPQIRDFADLGEQCRSDSDCMSSLCFVNRCTEECGPQNSCPSGTTCAEEEDVCTFDTNLPLEGPMNISMLLIDRVDDYGWSKAQDDGRAYILENLDDVSVELLTNVNPLTATEAISNSISSGSNLFINTHETLFPYIQSASSLNQSVTFLSCGEAESNFNLGNYSSRMYQVLYIVGALAGRLSTTHRIGVVGPDASSASVRWINAFARGALSQDSSTRIVVRWIESRFNATRERQFAEELAGNGVDIVLSLADSTTVAETVCSLTTPEFQDVYYIGFMNENQCDVCQSRCLTSAYWNWGPLVESILEDMREGEWVPSQFVWKQMEQNPDRSSVYFSDINNDLVVSTDIVAVENLIPELTRDTEGSRMYPFRGPVRDSSGAVRIDGGDNPSDEDLLQMCWFVQGIVDLDDSPATVPEDCE